MLFVTFQFAIFFVALLVLLRLLSGHRNIREVVLFPQLRSR